LESRKAWLGLRSFCSVSRRSIIGRRTGKRLAPFGSAQGYQSLYRYRIGGLRVVYEVSLAARAVGVVAILPRGDVYKRI